MIATMNLQCFHDHKHEFAEVLGSQMKIGSSLEIIVANLQQFCSCSYKLAMIL